MTLYAQGDIIIERVDDATGAPIGHAGSGQFGTDSDGSSVLARGEVTGHRHRFIATSDVMLFRDDSLARGVPAELYIGHVKIGSAGADLVHEEHDTISLPSGCYRIRRQREWTAEQARVVAD